MYKAMVLLKGVNNGKEPLRFAVSKGDTIPVGGMGTVRVLLVDESSVWLDAGKILVQRDTSTSPESAKNPLRLQIGESIFLGAWELSLLECQGENQKPTSAEKKPLKIKKPKISWLETQALIVKLEEKLGTKVIGYYTAPNANIEQSHPDLFIDHLRKIAAPGKVALIVISSGGWSIASLRIATILREYCQTLDILIPSRCASAATNLALSADRIIMSPGGYLTAIDSSIAHELNPKGASGRPAMVSVDQVKRVLKFLQDEGPAKTEQGMSEGAYRTLFKYLHPLALGEIDRNSSASELVAIKMMKTHAESFENEEKIRAIAKHLVQDYPLHAFPILFEEAKEIGLPVVKADKEIADMLWDLVKLYDSATRACTTHIRSDFYHFEQFSVIIESRDKRTTFYNLYNRRLNPITKIWQVENDETRWVNIKPSQDPNRPFALSTLDVPDADTLDSKKPEAMPAS